MPFFHTISRKLHFRTVEYIATEGKDILLNCLKTVIKVYEVRGFTIQHIHGDKQFDCLREDIRPIQLHTASKGEHVPEIERSIQTIKWDIRTMYHALTFEKYPPLMIKEMVEHQVNIRNKFPNKNGVTKTMGPFSIMTGLPQPSYNNFKLEFGQYMQTHDHPAKTNDMNTRTTPAIALRSSGSQNVWYFMLLESGKQILRYKWSILPTPASVIDKVHEFADIFKLKEKNTNSPINLGMEDENKEVEIDITSEQDHENDFSISYGKQSLNNKLNEAENIDFKQPVRQFFPNENINYASDISELTTSQRSKKTLRNHLEIYLKKVHSRKYNTWKKQLQTTKTTFS